MMQTPVEISAKILLAEDDNDMRRFLVKALQNAGLIRREVRGRTHLCRLDPGPLASAHQWLSFYERFWAGRLDVLERLLRNEDERQSSTPKKGDDQ